MPTDSTFLAHSNRFFLSSMVLWMPLCRIGYQRFLSTNVQSNHVDFDIILLVPIGLMALNISVAGRFDTRMQDWLAHSCRVLPEDSLVFVAGDGAVFGSILGQEALGVCEASSVCLSTTACLRLVP